MAVLQAILLLALRSIGRLLWDTGLPEAELLDDLRALGGFTKVITTPLVRWLAGLGVTPANLTYLGFSHLHGDHAGNANQFAGSTVLLNARERAYAFGPAAGSDYQPNDYVALRASQTILIDERHDVFGDGTCVIHAAPGHQVLLLTLPEQPPLLLVGDLYYSAADRTLRRIPVWNVDHAESFRSMDSIERFAAERGVHLFIHHNADAMAVFPSRTTGS